MRTGDPRLFERRYRAVALPRHCAGIAPGFPAKSTWSPLTHVADPKSFLDDVFQAIAYKSYIPGAAPAPKLQPRRPDPPPPEVDAAPSAGHSGSKKRSYNDRDDADPSGNQDGHHNGGRPTKQQRKRGRGRGEDKRGDFSAMGMPSFDPQNPATMEAFMAMAMQYPGMGQFMGNGSRGQPRRRGRCRDFDSKGYCSRGTSCMYDHGNESLYIPSGPQGDGEMVFFFSPPFPRHMIANLRLICSQNMTLIRLCSQATYFPF